MERVERSATFAVGGARPLCRFIAAFGSPPGSPVVLGSAALNVDVEAQQLHWKQGRAVSVAVRPPYTLIFT